MNKAVYLAGPMEGVSREAMTGWRIKFIAEASRHGIICLDPTRRVEYHQEAGLDYARFVFTKDLQDIDKSAVVFVDARRGSGRGTGTSMEAMYAWMNKKPIIVWADPGDFRHPFYESMQTVRVESLEDGITSTASFFL